MEVIAIVISISHAVRTSGKPGGDRQSEKARKKSISDNITNASKPERGTGKAYTLDRLELKLRPMVPPLKGM